MSNADIGKIRHKLPDIITAVKLPRPVTCGKYKGPHSLGWVSTAQAICAIIAIVAVAAVIGVLLTNLPLAQLSYGPVLRHIGRLEAAQQIAAPARALFDVALAGPELQPLTQPIATPFGSVGWAGFMISTLVVMLGISAAPWLLPRCATTLGVYEARKSLGWAIFFVGIIVITLSAIAVFFRRLVMSDLVGRSADQLPSWFDHLSAKGLVGITGQAAELPLSSFLFARDGILYAIPMALDFPAAFVYLILTGAVAAAMAGAAATAFALSAILSEDAFGGFQLTPASDPVRINTARFMAAAIIPVALLFQAVVPFDPLDLFLMAMTLVPPLRFQ